MINTIETIETRRSRRQFLRVALAGATTGAATGPGSACGVPPSARTPAVAPSPAGSPPASPPAAPKPATVKWGSTGSDGPLFIAQAKGYFAEQGITLDLNVFATSTQMIAPLSQNQLQAGGGAVGAGLFNAIGRGIGIRIAGDRGNFSPGHGTQGILVRTPLAQQITGPADLKGRTYADAAADTAGEVNLDAYLRKGGLTIKDVSLVPLPFPDMQAALESGRVDVAQPIEPWLTRIVESGAAKQLVRYDEVVPGQQNAVLLFSEQFARERDAAVRFMVAYLKGARFYNDAFDKNDSPKRAEAVDILAAAMNLDRTLVDKMVKAGIHPDGRVNLEAIAADQQYFLAKGSQEKPIDLQAVVDMSFAEEAVRILGPYR